MIKWQKLKQNGKSRLKFKNTKIEYDGIKFDSKKEADRYRKLKMAEEEGLIKDLECQPEFVLMESFKDPRYGLTKKGEPKTVPGIKYIADFRYTEVATGRIIVEDTKSTITAKQPDFRIKYKWLLHKYKDIDFHIT